MPSPAPPYELPRLTVSEAVGTVRLMPLISVAATILMILALAAPTGDASDETAEPATPNSVRLMNADFRLPANTRWREERIMSAPKLKLSVDLGGNKNVRGTMSLLSRQVLDIDVRTEKDLRLKFVQSDTTSDIDFGKNRNRSTTTLPLDGKSVLAERVESGRWSAKLDSSRRPTAEEGSALYGLTYLWASGVYPDREVEIGETWKVDAKNFKNLFGSEFKKPAGAFEFSLARIVDFDGHPCAKITGKGELTSQTKSLGSTEAGAEETPIDAVMDLSIEIYRSIELGMDLSVKMTGTLDLSNEKDEEALTYKASSPVEFTRTLKKRQP